MAREVKVASEPASVPMPDAQPENTQTLTMILSQALKSGDQQLLESALGVTDPAVVEATLQKLAPEQVPSLIDQLVQRSVKKCNRLPHLLPWIRGCLFVHSSNLMANPAGQKAVQNLKALFEKRVEDHEALLRLAGRLDLMLVQVMRRTDEGEAAKIAALVHKPVAVYQADDDSDAEVEPSTIDDSEDDDGEDDDEEDSGVSSSDEMSVDEE